MVIEDKKLFLPKNHVMQNPKGLFPNRVGINFSWSLNRKALLPY